MVCSLSLLPAFSVAILVEFIPLKPPDEGWRANSAFWVRLYVSSLPIAFGGVYQVKEVIEPGAISTTGIVTTAVGSCTCFVALSIAIAALWKFPIPFGYVLTAGPFVVFYMVFFILSIGPRVLARSPVLRRQIFSQMLVIAAQGMLAIAYPTFGAIFNQLSGHEQTAFVFVLPIIKFCVKQFVAKASAHLHEFVGPTVVLSVDVCNVLYVAICVQTAISPITTTLVIALDAFFVLLAFRSIYNQSHMTQARVSASLTSLPKSNYVQNLIALVRQTVQLARAVDALPTPIRIRAPFPLPLSDESANYMRRLISANENNAQEVEVAAVDSSLIPCEDPTQQRSNGNGDRTPALMLLHRALNDRRIAPAPDNTQRKPPPILIRLSKVFLPSQSKSINHATLHSRYQASSSNVQDGLQALFHSEYVVMGEFIECVTPILYAVYLAVLYHLPTAAYYPHTRSLTAAKFASTETNLMLYALIELALFVGLNVLLRRKLGFFPLYQLAFVFETHARTLQSHLFVWVLCILQITLVHNGKLKDSTPAMKFYVALTID
ncbi:hypothetical protein PF005_g15031 [Phytophthora fragariae]|uniref:Uncharacterized protein n=1 Tax=Phytophthora fragariae TaxID=53985 RepID=A0A6A3XN71_9STRA|nr:hypothetical protein PF003_g38756 [Phytophthora fragariae]KAE8936485.1 hypothetical protein PF009_g13591 [Phytophthora fragariae]KAE9000663.1 hypothetical protein PF011_g14085 [Phytophthora fragariae]KAE9100645.1 hypothetical protein PF007_g15431 [Phytophthora fragariae]KAE9137593.1 hypothetical protein PF006_g14151 [Phytophthora fragariae]